jgi:pantoate--beta-alanine ligase
MKLLRSLVATRRWRAAVPPRRSVGFVPTMGALHRGHLALVRRSLRENDLTVVSIFVNPIQFGPSEDFAKYPRPFQKDTDLLKDAGVHALFSPSPNDMYPEGFRTTVTVAGLTDTLCGAPTSRGPAHFAGVATVVAKLFALVRPDRAYFGMKDFQQLRVIERMNEDLNLGVRVVRCPTVREDDGLAMSSRNAYLSPKERALAPRLYLSLQQGAKLLASERSMKAEDVVRTVEKSLAATPEFRIEYVELVDPETLQKLPQARRPALLAAAARLGNTRLIDNLLVS